MSLFIKIQANPDSKHKYLSTLIAILTKIPYFPINLQFKTLIIHSKLKFKTYF